MTDLPVSPVPSGKSPRRRRWVRAVLLGCLFLVVVAGTLFGFLPVLLSTSEGNRRILAEINAVLAPGRLEAGRIGLSWTGPTTLTEVALLDRDGKTVLKAPSGSINRSLWSLLIRPNDLGTLQIDQSKIELDRRPDGTINLVEALGRAFDNPKPRRDFTIQLEGRLTFQDHAMRAPFVAENYSFRLHIQPAPLPPTWQLRLAEPTKGSAALITAEGDFDRWHQRSRKADTPDIAVQIVAADWPWSETIRGRLAEGVASGGLYVQRQGGRWESDGDLTLAVRRIEPWEMEGAPPSNVTLDWKSWMEGESLKLSGKLGLDRLAALDKPLNAEFQGSYEADNDAIVIDGLGISTDWARLEASGRLDDLSGQRLADLRGTILPDYRRLTELLATRVEPNAKIAGSPAPWSVKGPLAHVSSSARPRELAVNLGFAIDEADLYGMKLGSTKLAGRLEGGDLLVQPIETTLNGGILKVVPTVDLDAPGGPVVRLDSGTSLREAVINDEVSLRVLSFVAPVLNQATQVNGRISADLTSAEFPISRGVGRKAKVEGTVVFNDVTFAAGPLSKELLSLVIRDPAKLESSKLVLDQPVRLSIDGGRIAQKGLGLPVGKLARIELEGWVDFERNLAMEATIPLNPELFPNAPLLNGVARATRIRIPIGGTLDKPKVDGSAMKANFAEMGRDLLLETGAQGIAQLFSRLNRPKDPNAPPPPPRMTQQERKAKRLEKKAERQMKRNQDN